MTQFFNVKHKEKSVNLATAQEDYTVQFQSRISKINFWRNTALFYLQGFTVDEKIFIDNCITDFFHYCGKTIYLGYIKLEHCRKSKYVWNRKECILELQKFIINYMEDLKTFIYASDFENDVKLALTFYANDTINSLNTLIKQI